MGQACDAFHTTPHFEAAATGDSSRRFDRRLVRMLDLRPNQGRRFFILKNVDFVFWHGSKSRKNPIGSTHGNKVPFRHIPRPDPYSKLGIEKPKAPPSADGRALEVSNHGCQNCIGGFIGSQFESMVNTVRWARFARATGASTLGAEVASMRGPNQILSTHSAPVCKRSLIAISPAKESH